MTTHRRYYFEHPDPYAEPDGHAKALAVLERWCQAHPWYADPRVEGAPFGRLSFSLRVWGRDQWWCHRRAMRVAEEAAHVAGVPCPEPVWEKLPPHENRGRYRSNVP